MWLGQLCLSVQALGWKKVPLSGAMFNLTADCLQGQWVVVNHGGY